MTTRKNAAKTRGRPFEPGNPGKPRGARHKATMAAEALLDGEAEALTRKVIEKALEGDTTALRLCLERIIPPRRDRPVALDIEALHGPADALALALKAIELTAAGEITPTDANAIMGVLEGYRRMFEITEIEARLSALEKESAK
jgi:hypothetical protein